MSTGHRFRYRFTATAGAVAIVAAGALVAPAGAAPAPPTTTSPTTTSTPSSMTTDVPLYLPTPSGPFRTGTTFVHLRDEKRVDPLDPAHGKRELMAQLFYPAWFTAGHRVAPYAPAQEAATLAKTYPVPPKAFTGSTHSYLDAPAVPLPHPVVFFYHGICADRTDTTAVDEELASRGYVVVALASTHESSQVQFPDGRLVTTSDPKLCLTGGAPEEPSNKKLLETMQQVRVADVRFVLDSLQRARIGAPFDADGKTLPSGLAGRMITNRVGIFGHSFGGSTAAEVLHEDPRFVAGVDLDGLVVGPVRTTGLSKPFLVLGSDYHTPQGDPSWADFLPRLTGWHRWYLVDGAGHYRFTDLGGSAARWGLDTTLKVQDPTTWNQVFGDIGDRESQRILVTMTSSFFDRFLLGARSSVLDNPSATFPEVQDRTATIGPVTS